MDAAIIEAVLFCAESPSAPVTTLALALMGVAPGVTLDAGTTGETTLTLASGAEISIVDRAEPIADAAQWRDAAAHELAFPGARLAVDSHRRHILVRTTPATADAAQARAGAAWVTRIAAGIGAVAPTLAVGWLGAMALRAPSTLASAVAALDRGEAPHALWIGVRFSPMIWPTGDRVMAARSVGARAFVGCEVVVSAPSLDSRALYTSVFDVLRLAADPRRLADGGSLGDTRYDLVVVGDDSDRTLFAKAV